MKLQPMITIGAMLVGVGLAMSTPEYLRPHQVRSYHVTERLPNGLYLVLREDARFNYLAPHGAEQVRINDYHFLDPSERGKTSFMVLTTNSYIPFVFASNPTKETDNRGRPKLMIELAKDQIAPLEKFTRENVDKEVAIVIGDEVVTAHRIREPIVGGKMQITRCTDNGCNVLYSKLQDKRLDK
jgi:hypothetical protein